MNVEIIKSNKGNDKLFVDGYDYHFSAKNKKTFNWSCAERKCMLCKGRVTTVLIDGKHQIKKVPTAHSHEPKAFKKTICQTNLKLKNIAKTTTTKPSQIIRKSIVECNSKCRAYLPTNSAQKQKISRQRSNSLKEPQDLDAIDIPENLKFVEGEQFVLAEKSFNGEKIIILGTFSSLKLLEESQCWLMDGTFYVVPNIMRQLFSIHGCINNQIVPLVFCLMSSKSKAAYQELFYELCYICCQWNIHLSPKRIISDFEKASVTAAKEFFPSATFKGCFFHFGQIIWRKVQSEGLASKYGNDESLSLQIRMLKSLAFVPAENVPNYFSDLQSILNNDAKKIATWFKTNYISGKFLRNRNTSKPRYHPDFWSIADAEKLQFPRTQNNVEAWHRRLNTIVGKSHVGVYKIISELAQEHVVVKTRIAKIRAGEEITKTKSQAQRYKRLKNVIKNRLETGNIDFLKNIAINIA